MEKHRHETGRTVRHEQPEGAKPLRVEACSLAEGGCPSGQTAASAAADTQASQIWAVYFLFFN